MHHLLVANLVTTVRKLDATVLACKRLDAQVHGANMLVEIRALPKATVAVCANVRPFLEMHDAEVLDGVVLLDETVATHAALEGALALVLGANVRHEVVAPAEGGQTHLAGVRTGHVAWLRDQLGAVANGGRLGGEVTDVRDEGVVVVACGVVRPGSVHL